MQDKDFDKIFSEGLKNQKVEPSAKLWSAIASQVPAQPLTPWGKFVSAIKAKAITTSIVATAAVTSVTTYFVLESNEEDTVINTELVSVPESNELIEVKREEESDIVEGESKIPIKEYLSMENTGAAVVSSLKDENKISQDSSNFKRAQFSESTKVDSEKQVTDIVDLNKELAESQETTKQEDSKVAKREGDVSDDFNEVESLELVINDNQENELDTESKSENAPVNNQSLNITLNDDKEKEQEKFDLNFTPKQWTFMPDTGNAMMDSSLAISQEKKFHLLSSIQAPWNPIGFYLEANYGIGQSRFYNESTDVPSVSINANLALNVGYTLKSGLYFGAGLEIAESNSVIEGNVSAGVEYLDPEEDWDDEEWDDEEDWFEDEEELMKVDHLFVYDALKESEIFAGDLFDADDLIVSSEEDLHYFENLAFTIQDQITWVTLPVSVGYIRHFGRWSGKLQLDARFSSVDSWNRWITTEAIHAEDVTTEFTYSYQPELTHFSIAPQAGLGYRLNSGLQLFLNTNYQFGRLNWEHGFSEGVVHHSFGGSLGLRIDL